MPPRTSRDFLKVAEQRLNAAEALFAADLTLDAQYVAGYAVECSFKALILEKTVPADRPDKLPRISSGATMHRPETLLQELRVLGVRLTPDLAKRMRRFDWTTDLRYETGRRNRGETRGFLRTCVEIRDWVKGQLS
ncbi:MAG: HEPN domain-containing protein [Planctomycetes bacterium]|nr:HEPN domain-containing protein [Planctomycetota bacterium]